MPDIYFVRDSEAERQALRATDLVERIQANGRRPFICASSTRSSNYLKENAARGDLIVTMGAGNIWEIGRDLTVGLKER